MTQAKQIVFKADEVKILVKNLTKYKPNVK